MAKSKRKIYQTQRDKVAIDLAKRLKERGIISKQAKLHGGKFISRDVLAKVRAFQSSAQLGYKAHKVSRATAQAAKERGFQVVQGNRIVGPTDRKFTNRLKTGMLTGVRPVKGGMLEEVILPHTVFDMHSLVAQLESGIDTLKMDDEQFAFTFHGNKSLQAFRDSDHLLDYLRHYKSIFEPNGSLKAEDLQEEFKNLIILRLHREEARNLLPTKAQRLRINPRTGRTTSGPTMAEKLARMHPDRAARRRAKMAIQAQEKRARIAADPKRAQAYKDKAKARAKESYDNRKKK